MINRTATNGVAMKGWFDAFRSDGGPTLYNFNNRTAVTGDVNVITSLVIFCTLYVAFLIIFPGIRKERFTTFFTVTLSLFVGAAILVSVMGSGWHVGTTIISSCYRAFSKEKISGDIGVYVGLRHVNITLQASSTNNISSDVDYNERFYWVSSDQMGNGFRHALYRGLPYPILTVAEYFSVGQEGLSWGGQYRAAGYFAMIMLWSSFALWLVMNIMLLVVPRYGAVLMTACGILLLTTVCGYLAMLPSNPLVVHLEGSTVHFHLGWCFWLIFIAGCICLLSGVVITCIEIIFPNSFSTILEVDYDTPYDRHIIIEDSHGKRFQKKRSSGGKLEEPPGIGLGTRILRRLSSKTSTQQEKPSATEKSGVDNQGFELEPQKPAWQYPFKPVNRMSSVDKISLPRAISQASLASNVSSRDMPSVQKDVNRIRSHPDKIQEVSMW